jgi:tetratricopeptide (TPR) repeat protein
LLLAAVACGAGVYLWGAYHYHAAQRALEEERFAEARRDVELCLAVWSGSARANLLAARVERLAGNFPQAETYLAACKRLNHGATEESQLEWLLLRAERGETDDVDRGLWRLVDAGHHDRVLILETLARAYMRELRFSRALACLDRLLQMNPDSVRALNWRGWVRQRLNQWSEAIEDYQHALKLAPQRWAVRMRLAELLLNAHDVPAARPHLRRLSRTDPDRPEVRIALARYRSLQGRFQEACALLDRVLADQPDHLEALVYRGKVELQRGRSAAAEPWLCRALRQNEYDVDAQSALYDCLRWQPHRKQEALAQLRRAERVRARTERLGFLLRRGLEEEPRNPALAAEAGEILLDMGRVSIGLHWLSRALTLDPRHRRAHAVLARYYEKAKQPDRAAKHRRLAARPDPKKDLSGPR